MTEHFTVAILEELRRIGVELDRVAEPLVATGFTRASLLDWLRGIPAGTDMDALIRQLDEHAIETLATLERETDFAAPDFQPRDRRSASGARWWPTTVMLDAGITLLTEEWDPIGTRLGGVPVEDIGEYAFHLFGPLLDRWRPRDPLDTVSAMIASIEERQLGLRPSPLVHRRYLAARLREIVIRNPLPKRPPRPHATAVIGISSGPPVGRPALDPEGVCDECHALGTVARVTVASDPPRTTRFCAACWRRVRSTYVSRHPLRPPENPREHIALLDRSEEPPVSVESRSWDDVVDNVRRVLAARDDPQHSSQIPPTLFTEIATALAAQADTMDGPMPDEIERFVHEYARPDAPPPSASDQH
jgi:hypothetical protein